MSIFLGIDIGTSGTKTLAINERGKILAEATQPVSLVSSQAAVERAGSGGLVAGHGQDRARGGQAGQAQAGRRQGDRAVGPDARLGVSRQAQPRDSPGPVVERSADGGRVRGDGAPRRRPRRTDPHGGQPGADRFHRAQDSLAAQSRAEALRQDRQGAVAQGRRAAADDRRIRHRRERRQRHAAVGRGAGATGRRELLGKLELDRSLLADCYEIGGSRPAS